MVPTIKITYFPVKGRAEPTRLALHIGKVVFEDERLGQEKLNVLKAHGKAPFQSFPTMTVDDEIFAESNAMLRYAGKLADLYPKCDKAAIKVDMIVDALETLITLVFKDNSKDARELFVKETVPRYVGPMDKIYAKSKGPYLLGEQLSIADLKLMMVLSTLNAGVQLDHLPTGCLDKYSHVMAAVKAVNDLEKVKEWNAMHA